MKQFIRQNKIEKNLGNSIYLMTLILWISLNSIFAQNNTFFRKYNLPGMQGALQLEITDDGGFVATGQHEGAGSHGDCDIYVYKLDVCGNIEWFKLYGTGGQEGGRSIIQLNDGNFLVSGLYSGGGSFRSFNMKIDPLGNLIWIKRYAFEWMMYTKEAANGDLLCLGRNSGSLFLLRTNASGVIIWSKQIFGIGDMGLWLDELPNGDIVFTSVYNSAGKDIAVGKLTSVGAPIWMKAYGGTGWPDVEHSTWTNKGLVDLQDSTLIVTSLTLSGGLPDQNILLAKLSLNNGSVTWSKVFGGSGKDQSRDIAKYPGGYAILGHTSSFPTPANPSAQIYEGLGEKDILLFSINNSGQLNWAKTYGGIDRDKGIGVKYNNDNGFSISAITTSPYFGNNDSSFDPLFIKTDSVGFVGCQTHNPPLTTVNFPLNVSTAGSVNSVTIASDTPPIAVDDYTPTDAYICQTCLSMPEFIISDTTVCVNDSVYFTNTTTVGLTCFQQWNVNGLPFDGQIDPVVTFANPGVYTIYLYSSCGVNADTMVRTITVLDPQITHPDYLCADAQPITLQANLPNGTWSGAGVSSNGSFNCAGLSSGYQSIYYTIPQYCVTEDSIEIRPLPYVNAGPDTTLCFETNFTLQGNVNPNTTVLWSPATNLSAANIPNPVVNYSNNSSTNAVINLNYTLTDLLTTCVADDQVSITIYPEPPLNAGNDAVVCLGDTYQASATGQGQLTWLPNYANNTNFTLPFGDTILIVSQLDFNACYTYDTVAINVVNNPVVDAGNDTLICNESPILLNAVSAQTVTYDWNVNVANNSFYTPITGGLQPLVVTVTDVNSCFDTDTLMLSVQDIPDAEFSYQVDCYSTTVQLTNQSSFVNLFGDQLTFQWLYNGNVISNSAGTFSYDFLAPGNVNIELVATTVNSQCTESVVYTIEVPTNPIIDFNYTQFCDYIVGFEGLVPANEVITSNYWSYLNDQFGNQQLNPTYDFSASGQHVVVLTITNDYPCVYTVQKIIDLVYEETLDDQVIPNVITPNNDGLNDAIDFGQIIDDCLEFEILILNRWGNVVFKTTETGPLFTGQDFSGQQLLGGVYFYKIVSGEDVRHGHITIKYDE